MEEIPARGATHTLVTADAVKTAALQEGCLPWGPAVPPVDPEFPLGVANDAGYTAASQDLGPDPCSIFFYTDGVIEAMDIEGNQFGEARVEEILAEDCDESPHVTIRRMRKAVAGFCKNAPQSDDITMIATRLP